MNKIQVYILQYAKKFRRDSARSNLVRLLAKLGGTRDQKLELEGTTIPIYPGPKFF
jgi:hypothetical protein